MARMLPHIASSCSYRMHRAILVLILVIFSLASFLAVGALQYQHHHGGVCIPVERDALLSFKKGITSDSTQVLASWHGQDCCRWRGVSCSNRTGHVIKLHLRNTILSPYSDPCHTANSLFGEISPSLLSLEHLEYLDLSMNCLLGPKSHIPHFLGSMEHLIYLNLSSIPFIGRVPPQLGNLSKLQQLDLDQDLLYPGMYSTDITWLTKIPSLQYLGLDGINLSRIADWPHTLNMIPSLRVISFAGCSLDTASQSLPYFNLTKLEKLDLSLNILDPLIASGWSWENMTSLKVLDLSFTFLNKTGNLINLCSLEILDLSWNYMNEDITLFMEGLPRCAWKKLQELHFRANEFIGTMPNMIGELSTLSILDLSYNNLLGLIPPEIGNLARLTTLDLRRNQLNGNVPAEIRALTALTYLDLSTNSLTGSIPAEIRGLTALTYLDMSRNILAGSIPAEIRALTALAYLDMSRNILAGSIPAEIRALTALAYLDISSNNLTGSIPAEIRALTALNYLDMSRNHLTGRIPADLGKLKNLTALILADNKITGPVPPEVVHSTGLTMLSLSDNHLNGSVPTEIGSLNNLVHLYLSNNNFSGMITEEHFANLKSLEVIDLSSNNLKIVVDSDWRSPFRLESAVFASCQIGPQFPAWLQQLWGISRLDISNTTIEDKFPNWFWPTFSQTTHLDISNNQISGSLPAHLDDMALEKLHLGSNRLTGSIPSFLANITMFDISNNNFSEIPSNFEAPRLQILLLYSNRLGGYIPASICKLQQLVYLDFSNNFLEGEFPQCLDIQKLQFLLLGNNSLSGKFPVFLQNNTDLEFLDLAWNKFSGRLPAWMGELGKLRFILLSQNAFSDNIPVGITNLEYLQYLDLSSNDFSGAISCHLSNLTFMTRLQEKFMGMGDGFNGTIDIGAGHLGEILSVVTKGQRLTYGRTLAYFVGIDLSRNSLTGEIPTDVTSLVALMNLNLSWNQLSGQIPNMIGAMQSLVSLDLSENRLSGEIPSSISNLTSLAALNLSFNILSGRIPSGRQLDTLNGDNPSLMYIGNSGLCGLPLRNNCSGNGTAVHGRPESSNQEFDPLTFYFGLMLGLVAGVWMVFCALLFKKTWRIAYFRLFDKAYDRVYVFVALKWSSFTKNTAAE